MARSRSSGVQVFAKLAVAGVLTVIPIAALSIPAFAAPGAGVTPSVLPAPPPADPPTEAPGPPAPHGEYYNPNDADDWWWYNGSADGGGG